MIPQARSTTGPPDSEFIAGFVIDLARDKCIDPVFLLSAIWSKIDSADRLLDPRLNLFMAMSHMERI